MNRFKPATRENLRLRMAIDGPSGSGKSMSLLRLAHSFKLLIEDKYKRPARIAAIDTEHNSLCQYQGETWDGVQFQFDTCELENYSPASYTAAINDAGRLGYDILIIDSMSHAWAGEGGALDIVGTAGFTDKDGWRKVTPMHNRMVESMLNSPCHVLASCRTKTEYVVEKNEHGKAVPRKIGLEPIQRKGLEYEFTIYSSMDASHILTISKSRCSALQDLIITKPGMDLARPLFDWLTDGIVRELPPTVTKHTVIGDEQVERIVGLIAELTTMEKAMEIISKQFGVTRIEDLTREQGQAVEKRMEDSLAKKRQTAKPTNGAPAAPANPETPVIPATTAVTE